jgi:hypothetical protein
MGKNTGAGGAWQRIYTDDQRDAMAEAYEDRRIRPARRIIELAAEGTLKEGLEPFKINSPATIASLARELRKSRAGQAVKAAEAASPDIQRGTRRSLLLVAQYEMARVQRASKRKGRPNPETQAGADETERLARQMKEIARAVREAAAIPEPGVVAKAPGQSRDAEGKQEARTKPHQLGGALLKDHRAGQPHPATTGEADTQEAQGALLEAQQPEGEEGAEMEGAPGSAVRLLASRMAMPLNAREH